MAPTSTLGPDSDEYDRRLSMYAGTNIPSGQIIGQPEIAIPLLHLDTHNGFSSTTESVDKPEFLDTVSNFMWNAATSSAQYEVLNEDLLMCIPGVGSLGNQHPTLVYNADWDVNANVERSASLPLPSTTSNNNPGRGSTSHYYDMTLIAKDDIPQGMEILVNDLGLEQDPSLYSMEDFASANKSLKQIHEFMKKHDKSLSNKYYYGSKKKQEMYEFLLKDIMHKHENGLFPDDVEDIDSIMSHMEHTVGTGGSSGTFIDSYPDSQKSISWLEENGQCIDGLYVKQSTILPNERGAFASRSFRKGDLVAPAPLMMIPEKTFLEMYKLRNTSSNNGDIMRRIDGNGVLTQQLITNYSFGHKESSLMFYPYGVNVNYINHQSDRSSGKGPNVKLVWTEAKYHFSELLEFTPENLRVREDEEIIFRLGMDVIANRDIEADEEIFVDYGIEWENEWNKHVQSWNDDAISDIKALELNTMMKNSSNENEKYNHFYTVDEVDEMDDDEYIIPQTVMTACFLRWVELDRNDTLLKEKKQPQMENWFKFDKSAVKRGHDLVECIILERQEVAVGDESNEMERKQFEYTVSIPPNEDHKIGIVYNVPQTYIKYIDRPYTSHVHSTKAFRHHIAIPDEIFPRAWRDL